jgi:hypothetical protein
VSSQSPLYESQPESRSHRALTFSLSNVVCHECANLHVDEISMFGKQLLGIEQAILEFVLTTWHSFSYVEVNTPYSRLSWMESIEDIGKL